MYSSTVVRMPQLFRIHIRPGGGLNDATLSFAYCLHEQVLGLGWQVDFPKGSERTWQSYEVLATQKFGDADLSRVRFLHDNIQKKDLIWTRDPQGKYYLAKVLSPWEYYETTGSADADVVNVVRCRILEVQRLDDVPGEIINCFRPNRAIQGIRKSTAVSYSQLLWNRLSASHDYPSIRGTPKDLFSYLDAETVEDVVFIYLQNLGWLVIPHSRKADTMGFEFILIHCDTKKRGIVQVKTGNVTLNREDWKGLADEVFLFQTNGLYTGIQTSGVTCLAPDQLRGFIFSQLDIMPGAVQRWVQHLRGEIQ
jgi:hypothetical protein